MINFLSFHKFLIYTNILIGVAAGSQVCLTYIVFGFSPNYAIVFLEGLLTLLLYNFSIWLSKPKNPSQSIYERTRWVFKHEWLLWLLSICSLISSLYIISTLDFVIIIYLLFVGILSLGYNIPFLSYKGKLVGLRQIAGAKVFHIAIVWMLSVVGLPLLDLYLAGVYIRIDIVIMLSFLKIIFMLICTIPFDIRDIKQDSYYHLKTLPTMLGEKKAILLCFFLLIVHAILWYTSSMVGSIKVGLFVTDLLVALVYILLFFFQRNYLLTFLLDAMLIVQLIAVLLLI